jgi:2-amino-4-hydroxy-6-hydroxymethyldihydropteridine diphosphokinase
MSQLANATIALGSNLGASLENLQRAVGALGNVKAVSRVYTTAPMYVEDQPQFLNAAVMVETGEGPLPLLKRLKALEKEIGRLPRERNGPREIDLDLISYGRLQYKFVHKEKLVLQVPHPKVVERRFVLQPLFDIDPDLDLPGLGRIFEMLKSTESQADSVILKEDAVLSL